ncbi:GC-rich sequence DNA-binding factor-like protein-domain-containing protein [Crassisporium funariophilum]|nr:GC-rich sequence DNA-binding factor-like protein-domain-containing protein [Crassisporium funariophilum]
MARRKRVLDDDDDSDSSGNSEALDDDFENDPDAREERALFENPYNRKRRRKNGKEDALYGVFAEDSEDDIGGKKGGATPKAKRSDWTKAPAFVTGDKAVKLNDAMAVDPEVPNDDIDGDSGNEDADGEDDVGEDDGSEGEDEAPEDAEYSDESEPSRAPSPRVRIEEEDEPETRPRTGGIGSKAPHASDLPTFSKGGIGSARAEAVPSSLPPPSRGGIGSKSSHTYIKDQENAFPPSSSTSADPTPSAFASRSQSFARESIPSSRPAAALPAAELAHFSKLQGSFGARMLAKMGWQAGAGLGAGGEGIVTPIESKLRPQKMGIAFKGFKEKTEQSKLEAKRRGEDISDDEDEKTKRFKRKVKEQAQKRSDVWKRPKKVKTKVEHKTYEQIIAEAGEEAPVSGIGQIIDATGAVPREVSSLADISLNNWSPSNDATRIPEVRHNIRLIADACKSDLDGLAREAKALQERKKFVTAEDARLRKKVEDEAGLIARLQRVQIVANDINTTAKELASSYEVSLEPFSPYFQTLIHEFAYEYDKYRLDEIVVAAIGPIVRRMVANWNPLEEPSLFLSTFRSWRQALKINEVEKPPQTQVDVYGSKTFVAVAIDPQTPMTPFESLLWNIWLPKVRTSINNDWSPDSPHQAVKLYEVWSSFLPPFIRDNLLDQLILPKVQKAIADWNLKLGKVSLQAIVFPWLPYVGLRLEDIMGDARRKVKNLLRSWVVDDPIPADLGSWKGVFDAGEWDAMLLKYVVPKLGTSLRNDFRVNPRDQKMETLHLVLAWSELIRPSIFSQILETEFFPKWLDVLHIWLTQPRVSFEEVAQWYSFWKDTFPELVRNMSGINRGFTRGLQLMNKAIELGPDAPTQLVKPDFRMEISAPSTPTRNAKDSAKVARPSARTHEVTFRSIVEEYAASHNLLFIPTGRAHERSRMPLFRLSQTADGKRGLLVYIQDDAVWAPKSDVSGMEGEEFRAISLEDMVLRAT